MQIRFSAGAGGQRSSVALLPDDDRRRAFLVVGILLIAIGVFFVPGWPRLVLIGAGGGPIGLSVANLRRDGPPDTPARSNVPATRS